MADRDFKASFDEFRKQIAAIKSPKDLNADVLTVMWMMALYANMEGIRMLAPNAKEEELLELSRTNALKIFDLSLLDLYGVDVREYE